MRAFNKTAPQYPQEATITRLSASAHVHPCSPMQLIVFKRESVLVLVFICLVPLEKEFEIKNYHYQGKRFYKQ